MKRKTENTNNKNPYLRKLTSYSAMAGVFMSVSAEAEAQIFYTDIPDVILDENGETYALDLNGDFIDDIQLRKAFITFYDASLVTAGSGAAPGIAQFNHIYATPLGNNAIAGEPSPYGFSSYPYALVCSSDINSARQWLTAATELVVYSLLYKFNTAGGGFLNQQILADGNWFADTADHYMGVRLDAGGVYKFAWVRMDVSLDNRSLTIKDFAFQNTAGTTIAAGAPNINPDLCDTSDVISSGDNLPESITAYSFNESIYVILHDVSLLNADIKVLSITGETIYADMLSGNFARIDLNREPAGIYILHITSKGSLFAKQLFISSSK
jgi:hypothetical protein